MSRKICFLGDVIDFGNGKKRPKSEGDYPIYGGNGILGYTDETNYDGETIIIGRVGAYCGSVYYENEPIWISDNALSAKPKKFNITKYLYYFLVNLQLNQFAEGSSHPLVTQTLLNSIEIEISDDVNEQKAIASVLTSLEDKIDLLHRKNITLEAMAVVLFRQWFVEKEDESWESIKIKNFDAFVTDYVANGSFASLAANVKYKDEPDYAILIRLTDFNNNFKNGFVYVDEHAYNFLEKSKLICGEVIISNVGAYSGTVFRCPQLDKPMTLGPNSIVIKSKHNHFFYLYFKSIKGKYFLDGIISGSAQPKFNKTAFKDLEISYPNLDYLKDFESIVQPFFSKIDSNSLQIRTLENLRDTLLPKLISGEVRVTL